MATVQSVNAPLGSQHDRKRWVRSSRTKASALSVEITTFWGDQVLGVKHRTPPRDFYIGEDRSCDQVVPQERCRQARAAIVRRRAHGEVRFAVPQGLHGWVVVANGPEAIHIYPSDTAEREVILAEGDIGWLEMGDLRLRIGLSRVLKLPSSPLVPRHIRWLLCAWLVSALAHGWWLGWALLVGPPLGITESEEADREQMVLIQHYLSATAQRERDLSQESIVVDVPQQEGGSGTRASKEEGAMGSSALRSTKDRGYGVQGPRDNFDTHIAAQAAKNEAAEFGMIGLLNAGTGGDPHAMVASWGRDTSLGSDALSARGTMWGDSVGDAYGVGGLGLSGIGEGGGGRGEGLGLGGIKTIGRGAGTGSSRGFGPGSHRAGAIRCMCGATTVSGRLPPEAIQRIIRANFGRYQYCYQKGLQSNPSLAGRVTVRFVIGRDGAVSMVSDAGSELSDRGVVQCVMRAFYGLSFPQPEGGIVNVTYPLVFSPT